MQTSSIVSSLLVCFVVMIPDLATAQDPISPLLRLQSGALSARASQNLAVSVRLTHAPTPEVLRRLHAVGATPTLLEGRVAAVGRVVSMHVPTHRLVDLAMLPQVERIDPAIAPIRIEPLNETALLIGAPHVWSVPQGTMGEGVLVADHEGGFDPFHPDFFRPDGGLFDFEDTTQDGKASSGDHIDLDGDGIFEAELKLLEGRRTNAYTGEFDYAEPGYQPDVDWLFVDTNHDQQRNFGAASGFSDQDPAMGEPIFVGDDVNQDGVIAGGERLVRLGTSKVRVGYQEGTVYRRGQNLADYPVVNASHGTGATGIIAMGWPELRRYTGIAPAVDLALINNDDIVAGIAFSQAEGADVDLYEFNLPGEASDGSSNVELAISQAAQSGAVQVSAAGNLAGVNKVMQVGLSPNTPETVALTTVSSQYDYEYALAQLTWHGNINDVDVAVIGPHGSRLELGTTQIGSVDGYFIQAYAQQTDHDNGWLLLYILSETAYLPSSTLSIEFSSTGSPVVRGLLFDSESGWGEGVSWLSHITDSGTALCPSTADQVIAVGAYGGKHDLTLYGWGGIGEHRPYSGMGPRIDGASVVDISAPDDPFTTAPYNETGHGSYQAFGGTSGALPHTAGAAALLVADSPTFGHSDVEAAIKDSALTDSFTGSSPGEAFGYGKLRIDTATLGNQTEPGAPPTIALQLLGSPTVGQDITLRAVVDDPDGMLMTFWWPGMSTTIAPTRFPQPRLGR